MKENYALEFNVVLNKLADKALSEKAKEEALKLEPFLKVSQCKTKMEETSQAKQIIMIYGIPPLSYMKDLDKILDLCEKGYMLLPNQLNLIISFILSCRKMKKYLKKSEDQNFELAYYGATFNILEDLFSEIDKCIRNEQVVEDATTTLKDINRHINMANESIKETLEKILRSKKELFSENYIANRNGKFVLPVKKEYKNQISGTVVDISATGGTCFIEPSSVSKLRERLSLLEIEQENEIRKILYTLSSLVDENILELKINKECMETLDYIFAKGKLALDMKANTTEITSSRKIKIINGKHPLLNSESCVPLNFEMGDSVKGVVITGPNTGGKTVALKTVGLLSMMAQSGLQVPADIGSVFCVHNYILCDIGDGQSITANLSTFSAHITNVINILKLITDESLVLLDELGSGTDPAEGMGLAIAILDELKAKKCLFVATTHYPEIKEFAQNTEGLVNARMEFDRESLKPKYTLQIGEAGESCALYIAQRLGFPAHLLNRAEKEAYSVYRNNQKKHLVTEFSEQITTAEYITPQKIIKETAKKMIPENMMFNIGDSVIVYPQKLLGIIYKRINEKGEFGVQIKGEKQFINYKRLKLKVAAKELYPEDYDFSIIFDSVENRKSRNILNKHHDKTIEIKTIDYDIK